MSPPSAASEYSEDALVEKPALDLLGELGWEVGNLFGEWTGGVSSEGRGSQRQVILPRRLRSALERLNPALPASAIDQAMEELTRDRGRLVPAEANRELYRLLRDGVKVTIPDPRGGSARDTVRVIDWHDPEANAFFAASQVWLRGQVYQRRADVIGFVNGIPLALMEFKAVGIPVKNAFDDNLTDYRHAIPQVFTPNAFVILSNGTEARIGSAFAPWGHFNEWKKIDDESEPGVVSLETVLRGVCDKARMLDLVENFTVFEDTKDGLIKKVARNHQYLGVNNAIRALCRVNERPAGEAGRLGVFWHTQGSGKSLSMVFFTQKILRTMAGNWTFAIITDRTDLEDQIHKTFVATGAVTEAKARAEDGEHLKRLLQEDHRYVFTLIQKFQTQDGSAYPKLSDRRDVIVITDEAHRSQYDGLALNMRTALPQAAFLGFTGTPLMAGEERTREVFGDYVSVYDFGQSIRDGATVPLYYENRIPELQLTNDDLDEELEEILEAAELDDDQAQRVEKEFGREYHLITRDDRLEAVADDLVKHFVGRGYRGKAMMVTIDKATAVRMYDKVQKHWAEHLAELRAALPSASKEDRPPLEAKIAFMAETDMAVVVSQAQNEMKNLAAKGLKIAPHRTRMVKEDLDEKFKDAKDQLRLVFVCAMWITGFDVPTCSTIYLDKPMKNHTLMQTIARANRTAPGKEAGLIVDYVGVFRSLQRALAIYGGDNGGSGDPPILDKSELVEHLRIQVAEMKTFCIKLGADLDAVIAAGGFAKSGLLADALEAVSREDDIKREFLGRARNIARIYKAILPDEEAAEFSPVAVLTSVIAQRLQQSIAPPDISKVMRQVEDLLDRSVAPVPYEFPEDSSPKDLSQIDFDKLREKFESGKKRTEADKLRALLNQKLAEMVAVNPQRAHLVEKLQALIERYNNGSLNLDSLFEELVKFTQELSEEEGRAMREGLSEEEQALFDILTKPEPSLSEKEREQVKAASRDLLAKLRAEKLVLDWRNKPQAAADVRRTIEIILNDALPEA